MPEVRSEYPFQISYEDSRLPRSLVVLRAETAEALGEAITAASAALDGALAAPEPEEPASPKAAAPKAPPPPAADVPTCPKCDGPMWDNRAKIASGEFKPNASLFSCKDKGCGGRVWPKKEGDD